MENYFRKILISDNFKVNKNIFDIELIDLNSNKKYIFTHTEWNSEIFYLNYVLSTKVEFNIKIRNGDGFTLEIDNTIDGKIIKEIKETISFQISFLKEDFKVIKIKKSEEDLKKKINIKKEKYYIDNIEYDFNNSEVHECSEIILENDILIEENILIQIIDNIIFDGNNRIIEKNNNLIFETFIKDINNKDNICLIKNLNINNLNNNNQLIKDYSANIKLDKINIKNLTIENNKSFIGKNTGKFSKIFLNDIEIDICTNNIDNIGCLIGNNCCYYGEIEILNLTINNIENDGYNVGSIIGNYINCNSIYLSNISINNIINENSFYGCLIGNYCDVKENINIDNVKIKNITSGFKNYNLNKVTNNIGFIVGNYSGNYCNININKIFIDFIQNYSNKWGSIIGSNCGSFDKYFKYQKNILDYNLKIENVNINNIEVIGNEWGSLISSENNFNFYISNCNISKIIGEGDFMGGVIGSKCNQNKFIIDLKEQNYKKYNSKIENLEIKEINFKGDRWGGVIGSSFGQNVLFSIENSKINKLNGEGNYWGGVIGFNSMLTNFINNKFYEEKLIQNENFLIKNISIDIIGKGEEIGGILGSNCGKVNLIKYNEKKIENIQLSKKYLSKIDNCLILITNNGIDWGGVVSTYCNNFEIINNTIKIVKLKDYDQFVGSLVGRFCNNYNLKNNEINQPKEDNINKEALNIESKKNIEKSTFYFYIKLIIVIIIIILIYNSIKIFYKLLKNLRLINK